MLVLYYLQEYLPRFSPGSNQLALHGFSVQLPVVVDLYCFLCISPVDEHNLSNTLNQEK